MPTGFICHSEYFDHDTGPVHPESSDRLRAILMQLNRAGLLGELTQVKPGPAPLEQILTVHEQAYVQRLETACNEGLREIDCADSTISRQSYKVALLAAGGAMAAVDAVMQGELQNAFCAVRPPGHHAEADRSMGFCMFNNIAVAAKYAQQQYHLQRVWILDWDVHHGNGTQHTFEEDPSVLYVGLHQHPQTLYPGTGYETEVGTGPGTGFTVNIPMLPGSTDQDYLDAFANRIMPTVRGFAPELVLISAGFDAHRADPLALIELTESGFRALTEQTLSLAAEYASGRVVSLLEGGYDLEALASSVETHVRALMEAITD